MTAVRQVEGQDGCQPSHFLTNSPVLRIMPACIYCVSYGLITHPLPGARYLFFVCRPCLPGPDRAMAAGSRAVRRQHHDRLRRLQPEVRGLLRRRLVLRPEGQHVDGDISAGPLRRRFEWMHAARFPAFSLRTYKLFG